MASNCCNKSTHGELEIKEVKSTSVVQDEIFPLQGNPYFTRIICGSTLWGVCIPKRMHMLLPPSSSPATICYLNRTWEMNYNCSRQDRKIEEGWSSFVVENRLKDGDGCVFELIDSKDVKFRVQILRGGIPDGYTDSRDGQSSSTPIVIDD